MNPLLLSSSRFRRSAPVIGLVGLLAGIAAFAWASFSPARYQTSIAFTVSLIQKQQTPDYQYDGYYAIKAAELVSQSLISWFLTPSVIMDIYEDAGLTPNVTNLQRFVARFKARQHSAQNVVVTFKEDRQEDAERLSDSMIKLVEQKGEALNKNQAKETLFTVEGSRPIIVPVSTNPWIAALAGLILGVVVGAFVVAIHEGWTGGA